MTEPEEGKKLITEAIELAFRPANMGVKTYVTADGTFMTSYVPWKIWRGEFTEELAKWAMEEWNRVAREAE